ESVGGRGRGCIASQSLLPGLEKVFRPAIIEVLDDPLAAAQLGDAVLAAQAFQYNADLVFRREVSPRRATDLLHHFCRRFFLQHGFLSHLRSLEGYDEPEILPSSTHPICLMSADGGQCAASAHSRVMMLWTAPPPARKCQRCGCCLTLPRFGGAKHANDYDDRFRHRQVSLSGAWR